MRARSVLLLLPLAAATAGGQASTSQPVIDMHLHALPANAYGPPPVRTCAADLLYPPWDARKLLTIDDMAACRTRLASPASDEENLRRTLEVMSRYNIIGVASGPVPVVREWQAAAPARIIPAVSGLPPLDSVRAWAAAGTIKVLGELMIQTEGIAPTDSIAEAYFALAEQLDLPVGVHVGLSSPGVAFFGAPKYRARLSNPLLFEEVLVRHPKLRLYIMHAGWPMLDEMVALMYAYPQVYVEVRVLDWLVPRKEFHSYLRRLVDAGFGKRVMFGSDQNIWPQTIPIAIEAVESAEFLTPEQKRDIFYNNAARFLRLPLQ
jgi:hypothetical protein